MREPIDDIALSSTHVYALSRARAELVEVGPHTLKVTRKWSVGPGAQSITVGDRAVYIARASVPVAIERVNLQTGAIKHSVIRGTDGLAQDRAVALGAGKLWVIDGGSLYWLDPARLSVLGSTGLGASDIWFGDGSLWAASENPNGGVERINPTTHRIVARSNADAVQIAFSRTAVWLAAAAGPTAVDPKTAHTIAAVPQAQVLSQGSGGIAVVGVQVWTTYTDIGKLQRLLPTR